ncbi:MAG: hypothetical protein ACYC35_26855 [Pirellulales bacterium]
MLLRINAAIDVLFLNSNRDEKKSVGRTTPPKSLVLDRKTGKNSSGEPPEMRWMPERTFQYQAGPAWPSIVYVGFDGGIDSRRVEIAGCCESATPELA